MRHNRPRSTLANWMQRACLKKARWCARERCYNSRILAKNWRAAFVLRISGSYPKLNIDISQSTFDKRLEPTCTPTQFFGETFCPHSCLLQGPVIIDKVAGLGAGIKHASTSPCIGKLWCATRLLRKQGKKIQGCLCMCIQVNEKKAKEISGCLPACVCTSRKKTGCLCIYIKVLRKLKRKMPPVHLHPGGSRKRPKREKGCPCICIKVVERSKEKKATCVLHQGRWERRIRCLCIHKLRQNWERKKHVKNTSNMDVWKKASVHIQST